MLTRWRGGPATAIAMFVVVCLLLDNVYGLIALAVDPDLAAGATVANGRASRSRGDQSPYVVDGAFDSNDTTTWQQVGGSSNPNGQICVDVGAGNTITSYRFLFQADEAGTYSVQASPGFAGGVGWGATGGACVQPHGTDGWCEIDYGTATSGATGDRPASGWHGVNAGCVGAPSLADVQGYRYWRVSIGSTTSTCGMCMISMEIRGHAAAPSIVPASTYFKNVFVSATSAYVRVSWQWAESYTGTWTAVDNTSSVGCPHTFGSGTNGTLDATVVKLDSFTSTCFVSDVGPLVLSVADTGNNQTASLTIPGNARGDVPVGTAAPATPGGQPIVTLYLACNNASANFCDPSTATGYGWVKYIVRADDTTATATVSVYPVSGGTLGSALFTDTAVALDGQTIHKHTFSSLPTGTYILYAVNASGSTTIALDVNAGFTGFDIVPTLPTGNEVCGAIDPACAVRNAVKSITCQNNEECWTDRLLSVPSLLIVDTANKVHDVLAAKQPFATILASGGVILGQLSRATAAVTTTNSCSGVTITVPLRVATMTAPPVAGVVMPTPPLAPTSIPGMAGRTAGPATVTVLDCATFESFTSQWTWWATVRSFMDIAVYAAYGYGLLVKYDVKFMWSA